MVADYKRVLFNNPAVGSGWVGQKGGAYNALVDGVDTTNIDDDAYFFYNADFAGEAIEILIKQGILTEADGATVNIADVPTFTFGPPTTTNARYLVLINNAACIGVRGGGFGLGNNFGQCVLFHSPHDYEEALKILRKQGIVESSAFINPIALSITT